MEHRSQAAAVRALHALQGVADRRRVMIEAVGAEHTVLHKDPYAYSAHPHIVALEDGDWLIVFNKTIRRRLILHPPQDPEFRNWLMRSSDGGRSWTSPQAVPGYDLHGVECAGLTALGRRSEERRV